MTRVSLVTLTFQQFAHAIPSTSSAIPTLNCGNNEARSRTRRRSCWSDLQADERRRSEEMIGEPRNAERMSFLNWRESDGEH